MQARCSRLWFTQLKQIYFLKIEVWTFSTLFVNRHYLIFTHFAADTSTCHSRKNTSSTWLSSIMGFTNPYQCGLNWMIEKVSFAMKVIWCICVHRYNANGKITSSAYIPNIDKYRLKMRTAVSSFFKCFKHAALLSRSVIHVLTVPCCSVPFIYCCWHFSKQLNFSYLFISCSERMPLMTLFLLKRKICC